MQPATGVGNIRMVEEAEGRRLRVWYEPSGAHVGRAEAEAFVARVRASPHRPLQVLVDIAGAPDITAEYREVVGEHFRRDPGSMVVALVRLTPVVAVMVRMFAVLTRVELKAFDDEARAVEWLEEATLAATVPG